MQPATRRHTLKLGAGVVLARFLSPQVHCAEFNEHEVGITCATLSSHMKPRNPSGFTLTELPRIAREELDMRVLDLATTNLAGADSKTIDDLRDAAGKAGCFLTNLKMNQPGIELGSRDKSVRDAGIRIYSESILIATRLGMKWVRPLPSKEPPADYQLFIESMRRLADIAREGGLNMLVENFGWMQNDPDSVTKLIRDIDRDLPASPDTGNWDSSEIRYAGLKKTFPISVTCDFKVKTLSQDREHAAYDLERCFRIGQKAGFRGPWCIEHGHRDRDTLFEELRWIRDQLRNWSTA